MNTQSKTKWRFRTWLTKSPFAPIVLASLAVALFSLTVLVFAEDSSKKMAAFLWFFFSTWWTTLMIGLNVEFRTEKRETDVNAHPKEEDSKKN